MIIKELELKNIRSHGHSLIRFPLGKTLLEGDIGSGKSSVLMAIEFALFGLGADSGSSVLKIGQDAGEVRMVFDVDDSEYEVTRRLQRKSGRVQQSGGELKMARETLDLSPSELKEKVLEILEFNEAPDPKAQSWIYRYAVYTPQEDMKNILSLPSEQRLQILRRAFRVEDYKVAAGNAEETARQVREDAREQEGIARGKEELQSQIGLLKAEEEKHKAALTGFEESGAEAEGEVSRLKEEKESLRKRELSLQSARTEREFYGRLGAEASDDLASVTGEIGGLARDLERVESALAEKGPERPSSASALSELKRKQSALQVKVRKLVELRAGAEVKLSDYDSIMTNGICPVCDRPAAAHDFDEKKKRKEAEREHVGGELATAEADVKRVQEQIESVESYREAAREIALKKSEWSRLKSEIEKKEHTKRRLEKKTAFANASLQQIAKQLEELQGVEKEIHSTSRKLTESEGNLRTVRDMLVRTRGLLETTQKRQTEIGVEVLAKEEASARGRRLKEKEIWLDDYFIPTVRVIEKSVLATINQEFDSLFKRWFGMMVSDPDKDVSVDEDFAPAVTQGGYEQDVKYLSGGERTSVALAYRLALNLLAQRMSVGMKSNLLILDEPTDGFSKEQLGTVREVLDDVGCPQVIIVSHDKELESFADQIFRVDKAGSESVVKSR